MILKMLDYEKQGHESAVKESWTYVDNIDTARVAYDAEIKETVVSCTFKGDDGMVTFIVKHLACLMGDDGKTIDRIRCAVKVDVPAETGGVFKMLQEAASAALKEE